MVKNVKRYQKQVKREGSLAAQEGADIIPATFVLPQVTWVHVSRVKSFAQMLPLTFTSLI